MPPAPRRSCCIYAPQLSDEARAEAGAARRLRLLCHRPRHGRAPRRRHVAPGRDRRMGEPGGLDLRPRLVAARRLERRFDRLPAGRAACRSSASFAPAAIIGRRAPSRRRAARARSSALLRAAATTDESTESFYGLLARETLGMPTKLARRSRSSASIRRSTSCPTSSARSSSPGSASRRSPRRCFATRRRSDSPTEHHALIELAKRLDLPAAQLWLANNGQWGARSDAGRPLSQPALATGQRLAGRSGPCLRPHRPGIRLPPHRRQPRRARSA